MSSSGQGSPNIPTASSSRPILPGQMPQRKDSYPVHTPSALSHVSSPGAGTSGATKRPLAPAPGGDARPERKPTDRPQSITDPISGKKKRVSLSCAQCAKRKQKCNREYPCQHCEARKVPELCVPYTPVPSSSAHQLDQATTERLERMENVLSVLVRHNPGVGGYEAVRDWLNSSAFQRFVNSTPSTPASPLVPQKLAQAPPLRIRTVMGPNDPQPIPPEDIETMERGGSAEDEARVGKGWLGELEGGVPEGMRIDENITMRMDVHGTPAENLQQLIRDCGVSPHKVQELIQELPPKPFADRVIDWYFQHLNLVRYPIDERLFRTSYEDLYSKQRSVDPANLRALPLVFIVLAMAVRLAPDHWAGDDQTRKISSLRMYWSSRRSILIATALESESIELVLTRLLSAIYLVQIHDRRLTECWSQLGASLRTAQAIGLHRDGSKLGLDPFQTEYRRRLWSYLYHADRLYSLILGRPPSIGDAYADTLPPSNVELSEFKLAGPNNPPGPAPQARPLSEPTTATFLILRRNLSGIIGRIVHHFQKLNEPAQYADVQRLQDELEHFTNTLPPHFRMREPDKSLDKQYYWLPVHRFMLLTEVLVTTIILHRPWLLRRLSSNRYAASRTACFESAKLDFQIRQDFQREVPDFKLFAITGQFKMFNSAMIAGISAIIDPRGPDADQMRRILTTFLEQHPWSEVAGLDETTRKEVQIIHTLSRRAAQIFEDTMAPGELNAQDKDSVSLLLALRQGELMEPGFGTPVPTPSATPGPGPAGAGAGRRPPPPTPWARFAANIQSPASSGHEEDHSQRLLDQWLSANASLAGGGIGGPALAVEPPSSGVGYLMAGLGGMAPVPASFGPGPGTPGSFSASQTPVQLGGFVWPQHGDDALNAPSVDSSFAFPVPATGLDGTVLGVGGEAGVENSDEYWNTLIDGILGTTGANSNMAAASGGNNS
ncbi:hypothetical protein CC85DRAFT_265546 [Cutaneotrichosporon oleaginosum]|uniref:Zn(2)-C6 fungal-type domain-containing protein n=1 Tax=Cutaneotrichosporon oleaginosum TaxID=879819 RepID=A0A0J0XE31_9TREE|nr:uncharacterized protein CC85DRAFT_265546 [Cutaneotrichosporon oleaginosum]KLT39360.1 hypothetical protein CC85DRAFT_265546 [Cutaneotrichosporon oleaginosum]